MPYETVNGFQMYYDEFGAGPPVVFVHGHTFDRRIWDEQAGPFSRRHQVVRVDLRGHGRSESPESGHTVPQFTEDLTALIERLGLDRPVVVGHSMGNGAALGYALARPAGLRGLVMVSGGLGGGGPLSQKLRDYQQKLYDEFLAHGKTEEWIAGRTGKLLREGTAHRAEKTELIASTVRIWSMGSIGYFSPDPPPSPSHDLEKLGEQLKAPALAVVGEHDGGMFHKGADRLVETVPGARKCVVPDAAHMPQMDNPEFFNNALLEFIESTQRN